METHQQAPKRLRILCLHGSKQCGEIFSQRIQPLVAKLKREWPDSHFDFPDGSIEMPLEDGQTVPMRRWWTGSEPDEHEVAYLCKLLFDDRYDGVIGFSQGAAAAALLAYLDGGVSLKFAIVAGGYACKRVRQAGLVRGVRTIHLAGEKDECVPMAASEQLATFFEGAVTRKHKKSHIFPCSSSDVTLYMEFIKSSCPEASQDEASGSCWPGTDVGVMSDELREEFEAMEAIFGDEINISAHEARCTISLGPETDATLGLVFPVRYPEVAPVFVLSGCGAVKGDLEPLLRSEAEKSLGMGMIYQLVTAAREWLAGKDVLLSDSSTKSEGCSALTLGSLSGNNTGAEDVEQIEGVPACMQAAVDDAACFLEASQRAAVLDMHDSTALAGKRGLWRMVVGLVGKPSAGKSTFFNAVCDFSENHKEAKVGAYPFTTIDPNIGDGWFTVECPGLGEGLSSAPAHGFAGGTQRRIPITIKDVAGLVPGAYTGLGKGNTFLNELCDADVLIHLVDASGTTTDGGHSLGGGQLDDGSRVEGSCTNGAHRTDCSSHDAVTSENDGCDAERAGVGSPVGDVVWVRREIHMWIYTNVRSKWFRVLRKPDSIYGLFSGYHATRDMVQASLARCGVCAKKAAEGFAAWGPKDLHLLIANFLRVRFPMVLALNKADLPSSKLHIAHIQQEYPGELCVPVSAYTELMLCKWRRAGVVDYDAVAGRVDVMLDKLKATDEAFRDKFEKGWVKLSEVVRAWSGSGVLSAINTAVMARGPVVVYPVNDLESCECVGDGAVLRDAVVMRPSSTVADVYEALKALRLVAGDFVRAEARVRREDGGGTRPLRKDEHVTQGIAILRVMTNRKISWQMCGSC